METYFSPNPCIIETSQDLYQALFNCKLPTEDKERKITALKHLLGAWPLQGVYVTKDQKQQAIECFFKQHKDTLMGAFSILCTKIPYLSFGNLPTDLSQLGSKSYHIVITDEQLAEKKALEELEALLKVNPDHMVTLSVSEDSPFVVKNGRLTLPKEVAPPSLQRLRIVNPKGTVKELYPGFLANTGLICLDAPGLINVKKIGDGFLCGTKITSLDTSWFINVEEIGHSFLMGCKSLSFLDPTGFLNLKKVGAYFLLQCPAYPIAIPGVGIIPSNPCSDNTLQKIRDLNLQQGEPLYPDEKYLQDMRDKFKKLWEHDKKDT